LSGICSLFFILFRIEDSSKIGKQGARKSK
jgi:hypothetical protein